MGKLIFNAATEPVAPVGATKHTMYVDSADGKFKAKDCNGDVCLFGDIGASDLYFGGNSNVDCIFETDCIIPACSYKVNKFIVCPDVTIYFCGEGVPSIHANDFCNMGTINTIGNIVDNSNYLYTTGLFNTNNIVGTSLLVQCKGGGGSTGVYCNTAIGGCGGGSGEAGQAATTGAAGGAGACCAGGGGGGYSAGGSATPCCGGNGGDGANSNYSSGGGGGGFGLCGGGNGGGGCNNGGSGGDSIYGNGGCGGSSTNGMGGYGGNSIYGNGGNGGNGTSRGGNGGYSIYGCGGNGGCTCYDIRYASYSGCGGNGGIRGGDGGLVCQIGTCLCNRSTAGSGGNGYSSKYSLSILAKNYYNNCIYAKGGDGGNGGCGCSGYIYVMVDAGKGGNGGDGGNVFVYSPNIINEGCVNISGGTKGLKGYAYNCNGALCGCGCDGNNGKAGCYCRICSLNQDMCTISNKYLVCEVVPSGWVAYKDGFISSRGSYDSSGSRAWIVDGDNCISIPTNSSVSVSYVGYMPIKKGNTVCSSGSVTLSFISM